MKKIIPYILPAITLIWLVSFAISEPSIVGFTTKEIEINKEIELRTSKYYVIPEDAIIEVGLLDRKGSMSVKEFIERSGKEYQYGEGSWDLADYSGKGFIGNYVYSLPIAAFGIDNRLEKGLYKIEIRTFYDNVEVKKDVIQIIIE
jgi:hypothetical protein